MMAPAGPRRCLFHYRVRHYNSAAELEYGARAFGSCGWRITQADMTSGRGFTVVYEAETLAGTPPPHEPRET